MTRRRIYLLRWALIALIVCAWGPLKLVWEIKIEQAQNQLRYRNVVMTRALRDQMTQGLTIGVLAGFRSIVADWVWLEVEDAWQKYEWFKMDSLISLTTSLQPRSITFWDVGAWQLAWNTAYMAGTDVVHEPNDLQRMHNERFWILRGLDYLKRGIENNPDSYVLWERGGQLYQQKLHDYHMAAYYYQKASELPGAPIYLERFPAIMLTDGKDYPAAYEAWKTLWFKLTPEQREQKAHWKEKIISNIKDMENKLNIPPEKRVFPK